MHQTDGNASHKEPAGHGQWWTDDRDKPSANTSRRTAHWYGNSSSGNSVFTRLLWQPSRDRQFLAWLSSDMTNLRDMKFKFSVQVRAIIGPCVLHSHECIVYIGQDTETPSPFSFVKKVGGGGGVKRTFHQISHWDYRTEWYCKSGTREQMN